MTAIPGVVLGAGIVPTDSADTYPLQYSEYGKGGVHTVADAMARTSIPSARLELGMLCFQQDTQEYYRYNGAGIWSVVIPGSPGLWEVSGGNLTPVSSTQPLYLEYLTAQVIADFTALSPGTLIMNENSIGASGAIDANGFRYNATRLEFAGDFSYFSGGLFDNEVNLVSGGINSAFSTAGGMLFNVEGNVGDHAQSLYAAVFLQDDGVGSASRVGLVSFGGDWSHIWALNGDLTLRVDRVSGDGQGYDLRLFSANASGVGNYKGGDVIVSFGEPEGLARAGGLRVDNSSDALRFIQQSSVGFDFVQVNAGGGYEADGAILSLTLSQTGLGNDRAAFAMNAVDKFAIEENWAEFEDEVRFALGSQSTPAIAFEDSAGGGVYSTGLWFDQVTGYVHFGVTNTDIFSYTTTGTIFNKTLFVSPTAASNPGIPYTLLVQGPAHTNVSNSSFAEVNFDFTTNAIQYLAGGAPTTISTYDSLLIQGRTINRASGSLTVTEAATLRITSAPVAGTGVTFTNDYSLLVDAGTVRFDGRFTTQEQTGVASANNLVLGSTGNSFEITGTTQINLIDSTGFPAGYSTILRFASAACTVKDNQATSGANKKIRVSGSADYVSTVGGTAHLYWDGTEWLLTPLYTA